MNFDAPTVSQFDIPVQKRVARDVTKRLESMQKWGSKVTGVMTAGAGMLCFVARAGLGGGPNLSLTLLYLSMLNLVDRRIPLGLRYNILMDNTGGDNKNAEMVLFLGWLVLMDHFEDTSFFCQLKGHTFTVLDQSFNTMISQLLGCVIYTMGALMKYMFQFLQPYGCQEVIELHQLWDWTAAFAPHMTRIGGFCTSQFGSGMHECYIRKDSQGNVRMWMRKSSRASGWLPEGPGFLVFESPPVMPPPIARTKSVEAWGKAAVEATIRAWYSFMALESADVKTVKEDWEARFAALPADNDASQIDPALRLQWRELPRSAWSGGGGVRPENATTAQHRDRFDPISDALENPPVNPLTGHGRTAADVRRELLAWQAHMRKEYHNQHPVFQADYVFVQLPCQSLKLHRIASGLFMEDALKPDLHFQTSEYFQVCSPVGGFWGEFTVARNKNHDPANKKSGGKFVRHNEVIRDHIRLYNVEVVALKKPTPPGEKPVTWVRVLASSLVRLSKVCPEFPVPATLPDSHADDDGIDADDISEKGEEEDGDPPPPLPEGYEVVLSAELLTISEFLLWSTVGTGRAQWHRGVTTKVYPLNFTFRGKPYTHDARLDGGREVRGVNLTAELESERIWVAIRAIPDATREAGDSSGAAGRRTRPRRATAATHT